MEILCAIPVYNEEAQLITSIHTLIDWAAGQSGNCWKPVIVDNGSTDNTWEISQNLARRFSSIQAVRLPSKGRGRALRYVWSISNADILAYMDVDLSTDLDCLPRLIAPLVDNQADLAVGSRLHRRSTVSRGLRRTIISRCYNLRAPDFGGNQRDTFR